VVLCDRQPACYYMAVGSPLRTTMAQISFAIAKFPANSNEQIAGYILIRPSPKTCDADGQLGLVCFTVYPCGLGSIGSI
jgi:hypothetical protein